MVLSPIDPERPAEPTTLTPEADAENPKALVPSALWPILVDPEAIRVVVYRPKAGTAPEYTDPLILTLQEPDASDVQEPYTSTRSKYQETSV
jgi:hypothetical protein